MALGNGILTTETIAQAEERADPERGEKAGDAARAVIGLVISPRWLQPWKRSDKRSAARLAASQALYQMEIADKGLNDILAEFEAHWLGAGDRRGRLYASGIRVFLRDVVSGVQRDQSPIDRALDDTLADGWPLKRVEALMRAICGRRFTNREPPGRAGAGRGDRICPTSPPRSSAPMRAA